MGLYINGDFETTAGSTTRAYARIDSYRVDKVTSRVRFSVSYWITKEAGHNFNRQYLDESMKNATGLFSNKLLSYINSEDGTNIEFPTFMDVKLTRTEAIQVPVYGNVESSKQVPYVSFDDDGNEVTKYRTLTLNKSVVISHDTVTKEVIANDLLGDIPGFCYGKLTQAITDVESGIQVQRD